MRDGVGNGPEAAEAIFIVGAPRSGTELMRQVLNAHPHVAFGNETHYFDDLRPRLQGGRTPLSREDFSRAVQYFAGIQRHSYGLRHDQADDWNEGLAREGAARGRCGDDVFLAHVQAIARSAGKPIWGEKTPRHVFHVDTILENFPGAKVVVMVRDYRAVVASYRDWRNLWFTGEQRAELEAAIRRDETRARKSYSLTVIALLWASATRHGRAMLHKHGPKRVRLVSFETLLQDPETILRELADWLGIPFSPAMLQVEVTNSSYLSRGTQGGFDTSVARRWSTTLSNNEIGYLEWLVGRTGEDFGFRRCGVTPSIGFTLRQLFSIPLDGLRALMANRHRIGAVLPFLTARIVALLASPGRATPSGAVDAG